MIWQPITACAGSEVTNPRPRRRIALIAFADACSSTYHLFPASRTIRYWPVARAVFAEQSRSTLPR